MSDGQSNRAACEGVAGKLLHDFVSETTLIGVTAKVPAHGGIL